MQWINIVIFLFILTCILGFFLSSCFCLLLLQFLLFLLLLCSFLIFLLFFFIFTLLFSLLVFPFLLFHLLRGERDVRCSASTWHIERIRNRNLFIDFQRDVIVAFENQTPALAKFVEDRTTLCARAYTILYACDTAITFNSSNTEHLVLTNHASFILSNAFRLTVFRSPLLTFKLPRAREAD